MRSEFSALEDADDPKEAGLQGEKLDLKSIRGPSVLVLTSSLAQTLRQKEGSRGACPAAALMGCFCAK